MKKLAAMVVGAGALAAPLVTWANEPTQRELLEQIKSLQARVAQLEAKAAEPTHAEVDATVAQVLEDARRRSVWLSDAPLMSGWQGGKFLLRSEDGNFVLHPWIQLQFRSVTNWRDDAKTSGDNDFENGFEYRRVKFGADGNLFSPKTTYLFLWATNRKSGIPELEEAWVQQALTEQWAFKGGQFKDPFAHEAITSSKKQLAAERSLGNDLFTGGDDFVQGVAATYTEGPWRAQGAFHDGGRNNLNQNFQDFPTNNADWGAAARVEYKALGDWKSYDDFTALGTKESLLVVGAAVDYTEAGNTAFFLHTIDAQYEDPSGFGLYGAFLGRNTRNSPAAAGAPTPESDLYDWDFLAQAGYLLKSNWEPFARYEFLHFDSAGLATGAENEVHIITGGVNYYWHGHDAKFTLDLQYLPNGTPADDDGAGILASPGNTEVIVRAQFQLLL